MSSNCNVTLCSSANIQTIKQLIDQLIHTLPASQTTESKKPIIHLILDGGAFNGSYLIGALQFLKEMEKRGYLYVEKISGCSVGSGVGLLYFLDKLDLSYYLHVIGVNSIRKTGKLGFVKDYKKFILGSFKTETSEQINETILTAVNNRLYISYHDLSIKETKQYQSYYKTVDELFETIIKSCFIPYLIDHQLCYQSRFIDGITPYIFPFEKNKKIIYLNLCSTDKVRYMFHIKNETTDFHRILTGLLEMHTFMLKGIRTAMCSYITDWTWKLWSIHYWIKLLMEMFFIFVLKKVYKNDHFFLCNNNIVGFMAPNIMNQLIYYLTN